MLTLFRLATDEASLKADGGKIPMSLPPASACRLATGRSALLHLINRLPRHCKQTVLLPCYIAEGVIQPFRLSKFTILFYRLEADLTPVVEDVARILDLVRHVAVVVLIHYFGFPARSDRLESVLGQYCPVVIDDFAQAPFATEASGLPSVDSAQIGLYSLNKFLPLVDGAILVSNRRDIDVTMDEDALDELPLPVQQAYRNHLQFALQLFNCSDPAQARLALGNLNREYEVYYAAINADLTPRRQSVHSRCIEEAFPLENLMNRRSTNSEILYRELDSSVFSLVHAILPPATVPFCIPARIPAHRRIEILDQLFDQGILLSTLKDKWDFIPDDQRARYTVELEFVDEHVLIPVSEFITAESMHEMVMRLNEVQAELHP